MALPYLLVFIDIICVTFYDVALYVTFFGGALYVIYFYWLLDEIICVDALTRVFFGIQVVNEEALSGQRDLFGRLLLRRILALELRKEINYKTWIINSKN